MTDCSFAGEQKKEMRHRHHARAPEGTRIYAIGDMHGRLDLLQKLEGKIQADADSSGAAIRIAVYLGDYIDRGPDSRALIDWLIEGHLDGFETHLLKGNHEDRMLKYLEGPNGGKRWLAIATGSSGNHWIVWDLEQDVGQAVDVRGMSEISGRGGTLLYGTHTRGDDGSAYLVGRWSSPGGYQPLVVRIRIGN